MEALQNLARHITNKRWREVFLLTVGMLPNADYLMGQMKAQADTLLAGDQQLRQFLTWVQEKSASVEVSYKPAAVRAFYLALARALPLYRARARDLDLYLALALYHALYRTGARDHALYRAGSRARDLDLYLSSDLDLDLDLDLYLALARALYHARDYASTGAYRALYHASNPEFKKALYSLKEQLPDRKGDSETFRQWWQANGKVWTDELRAVMIEHRNIGHDWQFSDEQKETLRKYYNANKLLVDCLNSDCYVSRPVREEIESALLLPIS